MKNLDLISEAIGYIERIDTESYLKELAINRMKQFVLLNTPTQKGGKVKIYDWVGKENYRPNLMGVFHDAENKVAVATDTHALIVSKSDYVECEESHIVAKNGDEIRGRYADYKSVMPDTDECLLFDVDRDKIQRILTEYKAERKLDKSVEYLAINIGSPDKPLYLTPGNCKLLLQLPDGDFFVVAGDGYKSRPLSYESADENYRAIFMPMYFPERNEDVIRKED